MNGKRYLMRERVMRFLSGILTCCALLFSLANSPLAAQAANTGVPGAQVFVFLQRAPSHVSRSKPEVFHDVVNDLLDYMKQKSVATATDQFGGRTHSEDLMPLETVRGIARDAGATYLLYGLVERPVTKWIKITLTCYDLTGQKLWEEVAESGGGLTGGHGLSVTFDRLHEKLGKRLGQTGLPVAMPSTNTTEAVPTPPPAAPQK